MLTKLEDRDCKRVSDGKRASDGNERSDGQPAGATDGSQINVTSKASRAAARKEGKLARKEGSASDAATRKAGRKLSSKSSRKVLPLARGAKDVSSSSDSGEESGSVAPTLLDGVPEAAREPVTDHDSAENESADAVDTKSAVAVDTAAGVARDTATTRDLKRRFTKASHAATGQGCNGYLPLTTYLLQVESSGKWESKVS
jgi:hypothetical protein